MRLFQDAAGTIPAYEAGQPVGKVARAAGTIDATQATALSRPTLARWPKGGRRNLVSTSTLTASGWSIYNGEIGRAAASTPWANGFPAYEMSIKASGTSVRRFGLSSSTGLPAVNAGDQFTLSAYIYVENAALAAALSMYMLETNRNVGGQITPGQWSRISMTATATVNGQTMNVQPIRINSSAHDGSTFLLAGVMLERGGEVTNFQHITDATNIVEAGVLDIWHLWNDGGDSLLAPLPTGAHEVATVTPMGKVDYATVTGDGTGKNILFGERVADIFARPGALSDAERLRLEEYWQQRYGAGYLIPPGMTPGARLMRQESTGNTPAAVSQPVGLLALSASNVFGPELRDRSVAATTGSPTVASQINTMTGDGRVHRDDASNIGSVRMPDLEPGATYEISFSQITGGTLSFRQASSSGSIVGSATEANPRAVFTAASTVNFVSLSANGTTISFTGMSLRKVNAPIIRQETALSRPTLARWPKGGRRNLIANTFGIATVAGVTATIVEPGVWELNNLGAAAGQRADWSVPADRAPPGSTLTFSVEVKSAGEYGSLAMIGIRNSAGASVSQAAYVERLTDSWQRMVATLTLGADNTNGAQLRINNRSGDVNKVLVRNPQIEIGPAATPYQAVSSITDITEAGVPDVWHLYNDGGDSLPAVLPAGAYEIAWVNHLGAIGYASVISDGTAGTDLLRAERMADVALKRGRFTSYEKSQLETQWGKYKP